jgi:hypothetical protein
MPLQYPLYLMDNENLIVVINPIFAYMYKDFNTSNSIREGFEMLEYTTRKAVRQLEKTGTPITAYEFGDFLIGGITAKVRSCVNAILRVENISAEDKKALILFSGSLPNHAFIKHLLTGYPPILDSQPNTL